MNSFSDEPAAWFSLEGNPRHLTELINEVRARHDSTSAAMPLQVHPTLVGTIVGVPLSEDPWNTLTGSARLISVLETLEHLIALQTDPTPSPPID